jgi:hypothetical protein
MTDKPSAETSGDAEFQRWFAEQDPFGNSKTAQQTREPKTAKARIPASGIFRFGVALPAVILIVGFLALAFVAGTMLRSLH